MSVGPVVCALIPACGGSKGIPGKNIRSFAGMALLASRIDAALHALERFLREGADSRFSASALPGVLWRVTTDEPAEWELLERLFALREGDR